jgi:hypothetical protein
MVQVDIVWAYSFGATFAACAARQLEHQEKIFDNKWYVFTLLFLSIFFAPSGLYLLWQFVQWETMQVAHTFSDLPAWLVCGFAVTNVTQGILGYWTTCKLIKKGKYYAAHANWMWSWVLFWFILVCGWDCTGYQRFLYDASLFGGEPWTPGRHMGIGFLTSHVWFTLVVMAVCFAPMLVHGTAGFLREGARLDPAIGKGEVPSSVRLLALVFGAQWVVCLALAIVASLMVMGARRVTGSTMAGYLIGVPAFVVLAQILLFRRGMPMHRLARQIYLREPGNDGRGLLPAGGPGDVR